MLWVVCAGTMGHTGREAMWGGLKEIVDGQTMMESM